MTKKLIKNVINLSVALSALCLFHVSAHAEEEADILVEDFVSSLGSDPVAALEEKYRIDRQNALNNGTSIDSSSVLQPETKKNYIYKGDKGLFYGVDLPERVFNNIK